MKDKEKSGFFDFLKNSNVKKLEKKGKDRYGADKPKYEDGGIAKKRDKIRKKGQKKVADKTKERNSKLYEGIMGLFDGKKKK